MQFDISSNIYQRASSLYEKRRRDEIPVQSIILPCQLDDAFAWASHQKWRTKVTVHPPAGMAPAVPGIEPEMAWFSPDHAAFEGTPCISARLTTDGSIDSTFVGWLQVHKDVVVWLGWGSDNNIYIEWSDLSCSGSSLYGKDQHGRVWFIRFTLWYAGFVRPWPWWLLPGSP
jgi:hypothetical protein